MIPWSKFDFLIFENTGQQPHTVEVHGTTLLNIDSTVLLCAKVLNCGFCGEKCSAPPALVLLDASEGQTKEKGTRAITGSQVRYL